jgi:hypothetical protein
LAKAAAGKAASHTSTPCEVTLGTFPRASKHTQERTKRAVAAVVTMVACQVGSKEGERTMNGKTTEKKKKR